jgi:hypothetical protein
MSRLSGRRHPHQDYGAVGRSAIQVPKCFDWPLRVWYAAEAVQVSRVAWPLAWKSSEIDFVVQGYGHQRNRLLHLLRCLRVNLGVKVRSCFSLICEAWPTRRKVGPSLSALNGTDIACASSLTAMHWVSSLAPLYLSFSIGSNLLDRRIFLLWRRLPPSSLALRSITVVDLCRQPQPRWKEMSEGTALQYAMLTQRQTTLEPFSLSRRHQMVEPLVHALEAISSLLETRNHVNLALAGA